MRGGDRGGSFWWHVYLLDLKSGSCLYVWTTLSLLTCKLGHMKHPPHRLIKRNGNRHKVPSMVPDIWWVEWPFMDPDSWQRDTFPPLSQGTETCMLAWLSVVFPRIVGIHIEITLVHMELPWLLHRSLCSGLSLHPCALQPSALGALAAGGHHPGWPPHPRLPRPHVLTDPPLPPLHWPSFTRVHQACSAFTLWNELCSWCFELWLTSSLFFSFSYVDLKGRDCFISLFPGMTVFIV